jgi:LPS sulfotransferase NodH
MDMVTAAGLFPHSSEYTLLAEFPFGSFDCFKHSSCRDKATTSAKDWFGHVGARSFAYSVTTEMKRYFGEVGVLPSLLFTMNQLGYVVKGGKIEEHGKASSITIEGCKSNGRFGCEMKRFRYAAAWVDSQEVLNDFTQLMPPTPWITMTKAGPHWLWKDDWFSSSILANSKVILQDESGMRPRLFLKNPFWNIKLFGDFLNFTASQAASFKADTNELKMLYQKQGGFSPLPFKFGYVEWGTKYGSMLLAVKHDEPEFNENYISRPKFFVVLSTQRSGSSWLSSLIGSHPDVYFDRKQESMIDWSPGRESSLKDRGIEFTAENYVKSLDEIWHNLMTDSPKSSLVVGFKLMWNQIRFPDEAAAWFRSKNVEILHIERITTILQLASSLQGRNDGYHKHSHSQELHGSSVEVPLNKALSFTENMAESNLNMHCWGQSVSRHYMHFTYEDLVENTKIVLTEIFSKMGLFDKDLVHGNNGMELFLKLHEQPCSERISNLKEVTHALKSSTAMCMC